MAQLTLRVPDEMVARFKAAAGAMHRSVNSWANSVLAAAVDPDLAGEEMAVTRARLARAGLLEPRMEAASRERPSAADVTRARSAAGRGRALAELVSEGRR
jgi:plasmid stability protein